MVPGSDSGLAGRSDHECQSGCDPANFHSGGNAGPCIFLQEYPTVFYNTDRILYCGMAGGPFMGAHHGKTAEWQLSDGFIWNGERFRSLDHDVCTGACRSRYMYCVWTHFTEIQVYRRID